VSDYSYYLLTKFNSSLNAITFSLTSLVAFQLSISVVDTAAAIAIYNNSSSSSSSSSSSLFVERRCLCIV